MKKNNYFIILTGIALFVQACKRDSDLPKLPQPVNEPEMITAVVFTFTDSANTANSLTAKFIDDDGDGGNQPSTFDTINLKANTTYFTKIALFNSFIKEEITDEIESEGNDHLFVYKPEGIPIEITATDFDHNSPPLPIGIKTTWRTGSQGTGVLKLLLKHQPGIKNGTEAPGDTDIDLDFQTKITN